MSSYLKVELAAAQRVELQVMRNRDPKPYLREKAAAILKVVAGHSATAVGKDGLLKPHTAQTINQWATAYLTDDWQCQASCRTGSCY
jgi:hypothetical protein